MNDLNNILGRLAEEDSRSIVVRSSNSSLEASSLIANATKKKAKEKGQSDSLTSTSSVTSTALIKIVKVERREGKKISSGSKKK
ncbi:MAG: hypothetical protein WBP64_17925 [Nitrososphaeraceae archaeon]